MQARMKNPALVVPDAMHALLSLGKATKNGGVPARTLNLVHLRASQINGCAVCVQMGGRDLRREDESDDRLFTVAAWRDTPYFTDAERAALALAESLTRIGDHADQVPDDVWDEAARHYDEQGLGALVLMISTTNLWNRLNIATRQVAGADWS